MAAPELLLISPPDYLTREFRGAQPLGIAYLAAALREIGHIPVELLDANAGGPLALPDLTGRVLDFVERSKQAGGRPVLGLSVVTQVLRTGVELARRVKAHHPDTLIILGGYHPTFAHQEILADFPAVDICVRGEGEETTLEIMQRWQSAQNDDIDWSDVQGLTWRRDNEIIVNPARPNLSDLNAVPFPARDLLPPLTSYAPYADTVAGKLRVKASIMSSRGCPFHCNFCSIITFYGDAGGKPWRGRSVDNVVAEMIELADRFGASHFEFQDDNFFVQAKRALAIVEQYQASGRDFSFAFLTRADQIIRGERFFPALRKAGLRYVSVGIESGSEASLKRMVKETRVEDNRRALDILHRNDVAAQVEFIMFEPGSTLDDLQANLRFIGQQGLFGYFPPLIFGSLLLFPGTPARAQAELALGLSGSIHEALAYQFSDGRVTEVYELLTAFQHRLGDRWYELAFTLLDGIPAAELSANGHGDAASSPISQRDLGLMKLEFFALTRIPYNLLRGGLQAAVAGQPVPAAALLARAEAELARVAGRIRPFDAVLTV